MNEEERLKETLFKKATGYAVKEETIEYVLDDEGKEKIAKRKVSKKYIPPDASALRLLIERFFSSSDDFEKMTDEELEQEREEIIKMLKEEEKNAIKQNTGQKEV